MTVVSRAPNDKRFKSRWVCECICGNIVTVLGEAVRRGTTQSCGCYKIDMHPKTHGMSGRGKKKHKLYWVWAAMIQRCINPKEKRYKDYGGRGITVCDRWRNSFENFYEDMSPSYYKHLDAHGAINGSINTTLDREDNDGNYEPSNCRWATRSEQYFNSRTHLNKLKEGVSHG